MGNLQGNSMVSGCLKFAYIVHRSASSNWFV